MHLDAGAIKDLAPLNNNNTAIDFSFSTKATGDKQAPVLTPNTGKSESDTLQLTFQEDIIRGKGSFTLVNSVDSKDKVIIPVSDISITHNVLTIDSTKINPEKTYLLTAPKGIVTDLAKNAFAGLTTKAAIKFDTHDIMPPELKISGGKATATNSPIDYIFTASEAIKGFTVDSINVIGGSKGEFKAIAGTNNYTLSVTPTANSTTPVTVNVAAGKFTDALGNNNVAAVQSVQEVNTMPVNGIAVDGYLMGSDVYADSNGDGIWNAGEAKATTDANGKFTLPSGSAGAVVVSGGTDKTTGQAFKGVLKAPEGSTAINQCQCSRQSASNRVNGECSQNC